MRKVDAAEGVRDVFGRILAVAALSSASDVFDLRHLLSYPIEQAQIKPSDKVEPSSLKTGHPRKSLPASSWSNGRRSIMDQ